MEKEKIMGRPRTSKDNIPPVFYKHYSKYKSGEINKRDFARICELSYPTIYKYLEIIEDKESNNEKKS